MITFDEFTTYLFQNLMDELDSQISENYMPVLNFAEDAEEDEMDEEIPYAAIVLAPKPDADNDLLPTESVVITDYYEQLLFDIDDMKQNTPERHYQHVLSSLLYDALQNIAQVFCMIFDCHVTRVSDFPEFDDVKDKIICDIDNASLLDLNMYPYYEFLNLEYQAFILQDVTEDGCRVQPIHYRILTYWGISKEELFEIAFQNMNVDITCKPTSHPLLATLGICPDIISASFDTLPHHASAFYFLHEQEHYFEQLATQLDDSLYVCIADRHTLFIIPANGCDEEKLQAFVLTYYLSLSPADQLSCTLYKYNRDTFEFEF